MLVFSVLFKLFKTDAYTVVLMASVSYILCLSTKPLRLSGSLTECSYSDLPYSVSFVYNSDFKSFGANKPITFLAHYL